jgi:CxxC-x17-CxxC domain-containing protein
MSADTKMHDVRAFELKCAQCGKPIEELPFLPLTSSRPIYCRDCNQKRKPDKKSRRRPRRRRR